MTAERGPVLRGTSRRTLLSIMRAGFAASGVAFLSNLLLLPIIFRLADPELYGAWIALLTVVAVGALADGGLRTEIARRVAVAQGKGDDGQIVWVLASGVTAMSMLILPVAVIGIVLAGPLVSAVFSGEVANASDTELANVLRALFVVLAFQLVTAAHLAALRGVQRQDLEVLGQLVAVPVNFAVVVGGLVAGWGLTALLLGQCATVLTTVLVQKLALRRVMPTVRFRVARPRWELLGYLGLSGLALLAQVSEVFDSQWDKLVLANVVGTSAVAAFHVGASLVIQAKVVAAIPLTPLLVGIAERRSENSERARAFQVKMTKMTAVLTCTTMGGLFALGPAFVSLWLGPAFDDTGEVVRWFAVAVFINLLAAPLAMQAFAEKKHWICAASAASNIVVNAVGSLVLTLQIGLMGSVYGSIIGTSIGAAVLVVLGRSRLSYRVPLPSRSPLVTVMALSAVLALNLDSAPSLPRFAITSILLGAVLLLSSSLAEGLTPRQRVPSRRALPGAPFGARRAGKR